MISRKKALLFIYIYIINSIDPASSRFSSTPLSIKCNVTVQFVLHHVFFFSVLFPQYCSLLQQQWVTFGADEVVFHSSSARGEKKNISLKAAESSFTGAEGKICNWWISEPPAKDWPLGYPEGSRTTKARDTVTRLALGANVAPPAPPPHTDTPTKEHERIQQSVPFWVIINWWPAEQIWPAKSSNPGPWLDSKIVRIHKNNNWDFNNYQ